MTNLAILSGPFLTCLCAVGLLCILAFAGFFVWVIFDMSMCPKCGKDYGFCKCKRTRVGADREGL